MVFTIIAFAVSAPAPDPDCNDSHYDQRQNGTDNIRVHIDGVFVAVFPVETMADALLTALPDLNELLDINDFEELQKPKPSASASPPKEPISPPKPEEKPQEVAQTHQSEVVQPQSEVENPQSELEKPQSEVEKPQQEADKPTVIESLSTKSTDTPISDVSLNSGVVKEKKPLTNEQKKALRYVFF